MMNRQVFSVWILAVLSSLETPEAKPAFFRVKSNFKIWQTKAQQGQEMSPLRNF